MAIVAPPTPDLIATLTKYSDQLAPPSDSDLPITSMDLWLLVSDPIDEEEDAAAQIG